MDIRMPTAAREPEWFCARIFSGAVLNFSFRRLGVIPENQVFNLFLLPYEFRRLVRTVGTAVFTLQSKTHDELWSLFRRGLLLIDVLEGKRKNDEFIGFMRQGYLRSDVFNRVFSVLAIIGELSLFLQKNKLPAPSGLHHLPFCRIYEHSLRAELLAEGGFERLREEASIRYILSGLHHDVAGGPYPNGIVPDSVLECLVAPADINIALSILREIYIEHQVLRRNPPEN